eukprot:Skav212155  [mRNA]  locus=scaffold754:104394:116972:+ [translate_table: standard]
MGEGSTSKVCSYLEQLYESVAETLPDIRDDGVETILEPDLSKEPTDAYAEALTREGSSQVPAVVCKSAAKPKQKQRKRKQGLDLHVERLPEHSGLPIRHLPPGCMRDYFEQFRALDEVGHNVSFSTFWRCWKTEFQHLRFRPVSSHSQCSQCVHHKMMLRELGTFLLAKKRQGDLYRAHLMAQYRDRQIYWQIRASSRLRVTGHLCLILDAMDQCKFCYPRSPACQNVISKFETRVAMEKEEKAHLLAQKVAQATFEQMKNQLELDVALIREKLPKVSPAMETALDMKYVKDRQCAEFGQACVQRALAGSANPRVIYYGILRKEQKDLIAAMESQVYRHWDGLESSPPKTRPRTTTDLTVGGLKLLSCSASGPGWPEYIAAKFPEGSAERAQILEMKTAFETQYPPAGGQTAASAGSGPARVTGKPDFTIEGGREPLDPERPVDLLAEAAPPVGSRIATIPGKQNRPAIILDKDMKLWLGNQEQEPATYTAVELFGFNVGNYEQKIIRGGVRDVSGLAWRLKADTDLVAFEKNLMPLCGLMHRFATKLGLGDVGLDDHDMTPKMHPAVSCPLLVLGYCPFWLFCTPFNLFDFMAVDLISPADRWERLSMFSHSF